MNKNRYVGFVFLLGFSISYLARLSQSAYFIQDQTPDDCRKLTSTGQPSYFFDVTQLRCLPCNAFQRTSDDGLRCVCQDGYRLIKDDGGDIECELCPNGMVASFNGWECVTCEEVSANATGGGKCSACNSQRKEITVERQLNGSWLIPARRTCQTCAPYTMPDLRGRQCIRCSQLLSMVNSSQCDCPPGQQIGGLCLKTPEDIVTTIQQLFKVQFGSLTFDSSYFKEHVQAAEAMCSYTNRTACQLLANLCTLVLYYGGEAGTPNACFLYNDLASKSTLSSVINNWPVDLPWLYYRDRQSQIFADNGITTRFKFPDSILNLKASTYSLDGQFLGYQSVLGGLLQLCKNSESYMDAAYIFGTRYSQNCDIPVRNFWDTVKFPVTFYELWLEFNNNDAKQLYAIPVLLDDYVDSNGKLINTDKNNEDLWQFVRRFFLVDNVSGSQASGNSPSSSGSSENLLAIRYAKEITIYVKLQPRQTDGLISPPYVQIAYDVATYDDYLGGKNVSVSFQVIYSMDMWKNEQDMAIAVGVLGALAVIFSFVQTWGWSRRAGKIAIDCPTLIKFLLFSCGNVANAFFVVTLGSSIWWLIFYKRQSSVYLIVPEDRSALYVAYLVTAFLLKLIQLMHIIGYQTMISIFLIDWERPSALRPQHQKSSRDETLASIWRTYFVANEWNEIQTKRKISPVFQYMAAVFFLMAVGIGNVATADPRSDVELKDDTYHAPMNSTLRFGIIGIVYLVIALVQWIFYTFIYERFFEDAIRQFVDLCSTCNVSVFILDSYAFGYYIHGRSVHGRADVGLREMHISFLKEESDLCSKRGLASDSDQQTFEIAIPRKLRSAYDKTIMPLLMLQNGPTKAKNAAVMAGNTVVNLDATKELSLEAYCALNRLLQMFIDHSFREADYIIKTKVLFESILDVEFQEPSAQGFFYPDSGHSFDAVLMYGHELTWIIFEVLLFAVVDLAFYNYFLDGAVTYIVMEVFIKEMRAGFGRKNLVKKTLIDKRFLI